MKVSFNVYRIDNHPNVNRIHDFMIKNWVPVSGTTQDSEEYLKLLIKQSKESNHLFYENGKLYLGDGLLQQHSDPVADAEADANKDLVEVHEEFLKETKARQETWEEVRTLQSQTSYGVNGVNVDPTVSITVGIKECGTRGWFEFYDVDDVDDWHEEGRLYFDGMKLTGYEGVMELSSFVEDKLKEWGYEIDL